jgi:hypothetical protein
MIKKVLEKRMDTLKERIRTERMSKDKLSTVTAQKAAGFWAARPSVCSDE